MNAHITRAIAHAMAQSTGFLVRIPAYEDLLVFYGYDNNVLHLGHQLGWEVWVDGNTVERIEVHFV